MTNIFLTQPDLYEHLTVVRQARALPDRRTALAVVENIFRPAGGGQPADRGALHVRDFTLPVEAVAKQDGETWLTVEGLIDTPIDGAPIALSVDRTRRERLSRGHSLTHLLMAAVRARMPGYESKGADLGEEGTSLRLRFRCQHAPTAADLAFIDQQARSWIAQKLPIRVERARSVAEAATLFPEWRVDPDLGLSGRIRLIHILGVDANPCSGSHVTSTEAIGPYGFADCRSQPDGVVVLHVDLLSSWQSWYSD